MKTDPRTPTWSRARRAGLGGVLLAMFGAAYVIGRERLLTNDAMASVLAPSWRLPIKRMRSSAPLPSKSGRGRSLKRQVA